MTNIIIPDSVKSLIGHEHDDGQRSYAILSIVGTGETEYYPSIKGDVELNWDDKEYWQYKQKKTRNIVRLCVSGNAVMAEDFVKTKTGLPALACSPTTVDVYV